MLPGNTLRNSDFSLILITSHHLRRVIFQLFFTKRPEKPLKTREPSAITLTIKIEGNIEARNPNGHLQRRSTWTLTPFSFSWRPDILNRRLAGESHEPIVLLVNFCSDLLRM